MNYILGRIFGVLLSFGLCIFMMKVIWNLIPSFIRKGMTWTTKATYSIVKPVGISTIKVCKNTYDNMRESKKDKSDKKTISNKKVKAYKHSHLKIVK